MVFYWPMTFIILKYNKKKSNFCRNLFSSGRKVGRFAMTAKTPVAGRRLHTGPPGEGGAGGRERSTQRPTAACLSRSHRLGVRHVPIDD